ncbi:urea ABC transporter permease subunit UrtB [Albirhodobacter sp. R86504]|uniref:urea ABC transporter permease subunit UrtB n=1 Tax=Albirhodobacter sp. R86504 TaxID=3093848 RepID=UPI003671CF99
MRTILFALTAALCLGTLPLAAQTTAPNAPDTAQVATPALSPLGQVIAQNADAIKKPSRQTIAPVIAAIGAAGPRAPIVLQAWADRALGVDATGAIVLLETTQDGYALTDPATGAVIGAAKTSEIKEIKPNSGVRGLIASALVEFQLQDPDPKLRQAALTSLARDGASEHLTPLRASIETEDDPALLAQKTRLERLLTIRFDPDPAERIAAIDGFGADLGLDLRGALNPLTVTTRKAFEGEPSGSIKSELRLGRGLTETEAYDLLVAQDLAPARLTRPALIAALEANIVEGTVGGVAVADLDTASARDTAYTALETSGLVPVAATDDEVSAATRAFRYAELYAEPDQEVAEAAERALTKIATKVGAMQAVDLSLDALSLASIYFLAAIGLAITFGVMGVINMAHGEFITMGAYTGYVIQLFVPDYTLAILIALPVAFAITFAAGVGMERLVIRHLYKRPLETLLATFGISIALQQLFKNIFGTQARPLTSPAWLDGALSFNDVVSISYIRIAIFILALLFLALFLFIMKRTRLGLEVRAVTQNPSMAASMGINPDRINMLTFGLGSGIAGVAGVAIGLFAKVTSELGSDYIVQSFMTVVVGGVGNIWGTLAGATLIGFLQKGIEFLNPSNTLAAQTYMIIFIIVFIQFRPRGIIALKGRAAGD